MQIPLFIAHDKVALRKFVIGDASAFTGMTRASASFFSPFSGPPSNKADFLAYLNRSQAEDFEAFAIQEQATGDLIGAINLSQIVRGAFNAHISGTTSPVHLQAKAIWKPP